MRILTGKPHPITIKIPINSVYRFPTIDVAPEDWDHAEKQVGQGKNMTVSVKSKSASAKRKPGEALTEAYQEVEQLREKKKHKKSGKKGH
jgi:hypothetical protein